ncbi:MAG: hypothetical protein VXW22_12420, partial [Pseudomonadota bacterium]|nr:hypothetical protein [Pseudomonadota bacterium]
MQQSAWLEADYQKCACKDLETEVRLPGGAFADCVSDTFAIEVESYSDWAEGIGQSLHYASETDKEPKLIMFCETDVSRCYREEQRLKSTIESKSLGITVVDALDIGCTPPLIAE